MNQYQWIAGTIAVESVLRADSREVREILVRQDRFDSAGARIQNLAKAKGISLARVPGETVGEFVPGEDAPPVIAHVGPKRMVTAAELLAGERPVIVLLDGVEDPFNFGQAVRSMFAAGIDGVIVRPRNWLSAASTVIRASAGATEFMPMAVAETTDAMAEARESGLPVVVATTVNAKPMHRVALAGPLLLVIGGEKRGVSRLVLQAADVRVKIPYGRDFHHSLGTAGAAAVLAFEVMRQRLLRD